LISERELWACADQVLEQYKANADRFVAERVAALAAAGDAEGVATWRAIATRLDQLRDTAGALMVRH
jgi:hypothetical protein